MGGMFSSAPVDFNKCKNDCISKCGSEVNVSRPGENPLPNAGFGGGGKRRKSTLSTFKKGGAKRKASKKQRH